MNLAINMPNVFIYAYFNRAYTAQKTSFIIAGLKLKMSLYVPTLCVELPLGRISNFNNRKNYLINEHWLIYLHKI